MQAPAQPGTLGTVTDSSALRIEDATDAKHERIRRELLGGRDPRNVHALVDPYDAAEVRAEVLRGRDRDHYDKWRQVMDYHRFVFLTAEQLNQHPLVGPMKVPAKMGAVDSDSDLVLERGLIYELRPHKQPQWRRFGQFAEAFAPDDLVTLFEDQPPVFDAWIREHTLRRYAKQQGIVIPELVLRTRGKAQPKKRGGRIVVAKR